MSTSTANMFLEGVNFQYKVNPEYFYADIPQPSMSAGTLPLAVVTLSIFSQVADLGQVYLSRRNAGKNDKAHKMKPFSLQMGH